MLYEQEEKKYYRFPSRNSLIDFVEYGPIYFPSQTLVGKDEQNYSSVSTVERGEIK